ncbi:MAG TPA: AAA family ATPase [Spirochaetia bacterium]|nr:AAA family ATPase [Spirochaetia bacterium]
MPKSTSRADTAMLIVFRGLPGTGKSHLARAVIARRPSLLVLSRDTLRRTMIAHPTFDEEEKALVDELILSMVGFLMDRGRDVVIDGMALSSAAQVEEFAVAAESRGAGARIIECVCSERTALARITADLGTHPAGDRGAALYHSVKARFQPLARPSLVIDTEADLDANVERVLGYVDRNA